MVDGLVRLLAPILPITTDELWRALPGTRVRVGASGRLPRRSRRLARRAAGRALDAADRRARRGQRRARGAAPGQDDRHVARGQGRAHRRAGATLALLRESAPQLCRCCSSSRTTEVREGAAGDAGAGRRGRPQRRRQVRPLLALRPRHLGRAGGLRRALRPLRRGGGDERSTAAWIRCPSRHRCAGPGGPAPAPPGAVAGARPDRRWIR